MSESPNAGDLGKDGDVMERLIGRDTSGVTKGAAMKVEPSNQRAKNDRSMSPPVAAKLASGSSVRSSLAASFDGLRTTKSFSYCDNSAELHRDTPLDTPFSSVKLASDSHLLQTVSVTTARAVAEKVNLSETVCEGFSKEPSQTSSAVMHPNRPGAETESKRSGLDSSSAPNTKAMTTAGQYSAASDLPCASVQEDKGIDIDMEVDVGSEELQSSENDLKVAVGLESDEIDHSYPKKKINKTKTGVRRRPNAFISIRVPSPHVKQNLKGVQEQMRRIVPALNNSLTSLDKLHLTLMVLRLDTKEDVERAKQILLDITKKLKGDFSLEQDPLKLKLGGMGHFGNKVTFVEVQSGPAKERLHQIAGIVRKDFSQGGLPPTDDRPFQSHLTVAKITSASRQHRIYKIPPHSYASHVEGEFGEQVIEGLELLSMDEPADSEGYYHCFLKSPFNC